MKRFGIKILLAAALLAVSLPAASQGRLLRIGVKGGLNFSSVSHFEVGYISESVSSYTGFSGGLAFSFTMPVSGMTLQPEINYISKGAMFRAEGSSRFRTDYIEIPVNLQYGLDLVLLRPYVMLSPYIGYAVYKQPDNLSWSSINRFEYGIGIGGGIDFWRFQLQVKYNWNIGKLIKNVPDEGSSSEGIEITPDDMVKSIRNGNLKGLEVNLVFFF